MMTRASGSDGHDAYTSVVTPRIISTTAMLRVTELGLPPPLPLTPPPAPSPVPAPPPVPAPLGRPTAAGAISL